MLEPMPERFSWEAGRAAMKDNLLTRVRLTTWNASIHPAAFFRRTFPSISPTLMVSFIPQRTAGSGKEPEPAYPGSFCSATTIQPQSALGLVNPASLLLYQPEAL